MFYLLTNLHVIIKCFYSILYKTIQLTLRSSPFRLFPDRSMHCSDLRKPPLLHSTSPSLRAALPVMLLWDRLRLVIADDTFAITGRMHIKPNRRNNNQTIIHNICHTHAIKRTVIGGKPTKIINQYGIRNLKQVRLYCGLRTGGCCCLALGRYWVCTQQVAVLFCVKWRHGRHLDSVTSHRKSDFVSRCVRTSGTILPNFIPILFKTTEP